MISEVFNYYKTVIDGIDTLKPKGKISKIVGLTIESQGPPAEIGEICEIKATREPKKLLAEVVGFRDDAIILMPLGDMEGIAPGGEVEATGKKLAVPVGEQLLGRILDGLGTPIDGKGPIKSHTYYPLFNSPPNPVERAPINRPLPLGIKVIDTLITCGRGQRVGIFAGSGVGKSTLLGMIARNTKADVNVIALIGERGRELNSFIMKDLGEEGLKRSVVVVATSDKPPLIRTKAAFTATAVAEYFRDQGLDVMLMMDSVTRFAMAQREVGLAAGEPPVTRGYTPSVFAILPKLLERAGTSNAGSITGIYTVLVEGDDLNEPISDTVRGILDGHVVLSRTLANRNHYPAIDVLASVSRLMIDVISDEHRRLAAKVKSLISIYSEAEDLINIGAYVRGSNPKIDEALKYIDDIRNFLVQEVDEKVDYEEALANLKSIFEKE
ncbi:flagellar protein export ATPase FliI [Thermosediminibacter litoriperuensis]|uniref:Type III secretion system FliI/YscN family ATPase n=1 Tax=Thermosediminibacter litoriperuensis TaxID=291989 RepID=A0A5S5B1X5_9FIRM|nr:flagellar protein export ATPase FliI [Thermosediminibacter litoriperuensis]TYP59930.1 type III secretion system FliI/YscN family ATPase [Thermosediminibacter litoriperuensis]